MKVKTWHKVLMVLVIISAILLAVMYRRSMYESPEQVVSNVQSVTETTVMPTSNVQPMVETTPAPIPDSNTQPMTETTAIPAGNVEETGYQPSNIGARGSSVGGMTTTRAYDIAAIDMEEVANADDELVKVVESTAEPIETPMVSKSMYTELS
jgi:hypothetical protein